MCLKKVKLKMKKLLIINLIWNILNIVMSDRVVMTKNGPLQGVTKTTMFSDVEAFLGIPYAEPPVGRMRFKKPVPKSPWLGVYDASQLPPPCIQNATKKYYYFPNTENMTEDCLYLNIWVPEPVTHKLKSVIIWIHGGAYNTGASNMELYDGATLAAYGDVVVATINYRVGAMGFFYAMIEDADGNMGLYDIIMAVRWIKDNVKSFGGNPEEITLVGESAGAMTIAGGLTSPLAIGLGKRVILQSGAGISPMMYNNTERIVKLSQRVAKLTGCASDKVNLKNNPKMVVRCLKRLPATDISVAEGEMMRMNPLTFIPRTGDTLLPQYPTDLIRQGKFQNLDMLVGLNKEEGTFFLSALMPDYFGVYGINNVQSISRRFATHLIRTIFRNTEQTSEADIANFYISLVKNHSSDEYTLAISRALGDYLINCNAVFHADFHSLKKNSVYFYTFTHRPADSMLAEWMSTTHFDEVQYIFGKPLNGLKNYSRSEKELSRRIMDRWLAFAKTGNPNVPGAIPWPRYTYNNPMYLNININESVEVRPDQYRCEFWRERFHSIIDENVIDDLTNAGSNIKRNIWFNFLLFLYFMYTLKDLWALAL